MNLQILLYIAIGMGAFAVVLAMIAIDVARHRLTVDDYNELVDYVDDKVKDSSDKISDKLDKALAEKEAVLKEAQAAIEKKVQQNAQQQQYMYAPAEPAYQPQSQMQPVATNFQGQFHPTNADITVGFFQANNGDSFDMLSDMPSADSLFQVNFGGSRHQSNGTYEYNGTLEQLRAFADKLIGSSVSIKDNGTELGAATRYITTHKGTVARMNNQWVIVTPVVIQLGK